MRIALRTSGGRGEYELAGHQAGIRASDLFDIGLEFQLTPQLVLPGYQTAHRVQGKPRIRLDDQTTGRHAYRLLAAVLMLPKPKRELRATSRGGDFVKNNQYAVTGIDVDVVGPRTSARLRPTTLWLENASGLLRSLEVAGRMALVQKLWEAAQPQASPMAQLVQTHESSVLSGDHRRIEKASAALQAAARIDGDAIGVIAKALGAALDLPTPAAEVDRLPSTGEQDDTDPSDAARRAVGQWRKTVERTAEARQFSNRIRAAYQGQCAVSGVRLPKLPHTLSSGVEGAHILPWARYELNTLRNGICLNKLCHWAFDAGVLRIDYDDGDYMVSIPDRVTIDAGPCDMDLAYFEQFIGRISSERLPSNPSQRPAPKYLEQLNAEMYSERCFG
jgi:HNH endonuclease